MFCYTHRLNIVDRSTTFFKKSISVFYLMILSFFNSEIQCICYYIRKCDNKIFDLLFYWIYVIRKELFLWYRCYFSSYPKRAWRKFLFIIKSTLTDMDRAILNLMLFFLTIHKQFPVYFFAFVRNFQKINLTTKITWMCPILHAGF